MSNHFYNKDGLGAHPSDSDRVAGEIIILGHSRADFAQAFYPAAGDTSPSPLAQSLTRIDHACRNLQLRAQYFALGDAIAADTLNRQIILFCISHLSTHSLYAQIGALLNSYPQCRVVPIVEYADQAQAACLLELGCVDYLLAPFSATQCGELLQRLAGPRPAAQSFIGESLVSRRLLAMAERVAATAAPILISGETGTGKEVLARYIHALGDSDAPFVAINCAAIPEAMLESLLFGHEKGAFTGAVQAQPGKFEQAQNGTLLLDEIGELPLSLQAKLLRVLQEKTVERLGGRREIELNVRVIAATNRDLREEVAAGRFRSDLLFRLDVLPLHIAPLRERGQDVLTLARAFIARYAPETVQDCAGEDFLTADARAALLSYPWPGNVRELENIIQRALVLRKGLLIQAQDLGLPASSDATKIDSLISTQLATSESSAETASLGEAAPLVETGPFVGNAPAADDNFAGVSALPVTDPFLPITEPVDTTPPCASPFYIETRSAHYADAPRNSPDADDADKTSPTHFSVASALGAGGKATLKARGKWAEYEHVLDTIARCGGHKTKAAASLGMTTRALRYRLNAMREQGISIPI